MYHTKRELDITAKRMAQYANDQLMHHSRGVFPTGSDMYVVFGNDGFNTDDRAEAEAWAVLDEVARRWCVASTIQTDSSGVTWAIAVVADKKLALELAEVAGEAWLDVNRAKG